MRDRSLAGRRRAALAAAIVTAGGLFAGMSGTAQAAPFAPAPAEALAAEGGVVAVRHGWGHHHHHGWGHHHHHGWGHRHRGWHHHGGWGHRHHHHHGWGWGGRRHWGHHHHGGWRHRW